MGTTSLSRGLIRRGLALTTHLIQRRIEVEKRSGGIILLPLWAFMACSRRNFSCYNNEKAAMRLIFFRFHCFRDN
jgi:hypothetical protein